MMAGISDFDGFLGIGFDTGYGLAVFRIIIETQIICERLGDAAGS